MTLCKPAGSRLYSRRAAMRAKQARPRISEGARNSPTTATPGSSAGKWASSAAKPSPGKRKPRNQFPPGSLPSRRLAAPSTAHGAEKRRLLRPSRQASRPFFEFSPPSSSARRLRAALDMLPSGESRSPRLEQESRYPPPAPSGRARKLAFPAAPRGRPGPGLAPGLLRSG